MQNLTIVSLAVLALPVLLMAQAAKSPSPEKALAERRAQIDAVDERVVALLNERAKIILDVGRIKRELGAPVAAPKRAEQVLRRVAEHNAGPLSGEAVTRIYERIIAEMTDLESAAMEKRSGARQK